MAENCTHDCGNCPSAQGCGEFDPKSLLEEANKLSNVKKVIAVVSGKGGVGKSLVTSLMAVSMQRGGHAAAIMDADVTGPSIPKAFGINDKAEGCEDGIFPISSATGIKPYPSTTCSKTTPTRSSGEVRSSRDLSSSSGQMLSGATWIIFSSICRREQATYRLLYSSHCRLTASSSLLHRRISFAL